MTKKNTRSALFLSLVSMFLCVVMLAGTTFAWFTDSVESTNNVIKTGTLKVSLDWLDGKSDPTIAADTEWKDASSGAIFNSKLWEPGYTEVRHIRVTNDGSLAFKYQFNIVATGEVSDLADVIDVYFADPAVNVTGRELTGLTKVGTLASVLENINEATSGYLLADTSVDVTIALKMQESAGNTYQDKSIGSDFAVQLVASQYTYEEDSFDDQYDKNAAYPTLETPADEWDGGSNIDWYLADPAAAEFTIKSAEEFAGLVSLVDGTAAIPADVESELATFPVTFEGQTIKLTADVDLYKVDDNGERVSFDPIGSYKGDDAFKGTFDGQGHTIKNLYQSGWALDNDYYSGDLGLGLFGLVENATIKNLNIDGAEFTSETNLIGAVAGAAYEDCTFENIKVSNTKMGNYQYYSGGIVGWASGNHQYINCDVDNTVVIASQWGDFDNSNGGLIGGAGGSATIYIKDCDVAAVMDVYNDVTSSYQWYAYRRCGMLIGNTGKTVDIDGTTYAAAPQLTAENCTVTYGNWANYTYCEFAGTSWPYVRVQAGYSTSAYSNPRYGVATDANGNKAIDDTHVHNEGEDHFILCEFDQLYGGGQGVYGAPVHDGVTVIYNNK